MTFIAQKWTIPQLTAEITALASSPQQINPKLIQLIYLKYGRRGHLFEDMNELLQQILYVYYVNIDEYLLQALRFTLDNYAEIIKSYNLLNSSDTPQIATTKDTIIDMFKRQEYSFDSGNQFQALLQVINASGYNIDTAFVDKFDHLFTYIHNQVTEVY